MPRRLKVVPPTHGLQWESLSSLEPWLYTWEEMDAYGSDGKHGKNTAIASDWGSNARHWCKNRGWKLRTRMTEDGLVMQAYEPTKDTT